MKELLFPLLEIDDKKEDSNSRASRNLDRDDY